MKQEELCKAFCNDLTVRQVPAGLAVSTAFVGSDGDRIGFYVREQSPNLFRLEDDGITLPMLEASGLDFSSGSRGAAMQELLNEYGVLIDDEARSFAMVGVEESSLPRMALSFVAFSLRVRDFILMTEARVAGTFREDVARLLRQAINGRAEIEEKVPVLPELADFNADFVVRAVNRPPVGIFLGTSDSRVLEAILVQMKALYETQAQCSIIALLERNRSVTAAVHQNASNRLHTVPVFRGDEVASIERIAREAIGPSIH